MEGGRTYANVQAIVPFNAKLGPKLQPADYVRMKDRAKQQGNGSQPPSHTDDDAPPF